MISVIPNRSPYLESIFGAGAIAISLRRICVKDPIRSVKVDAFERLILTYHSPLSMVVGRD